MATVSRPDGNLPNPSDLIEAEPIRDYITNILSFLEGGSIDEDNVDTSSTDGIVGMSVSQTITGLKRFLRTSTATGTSTALTLGRNRSTGGASDDDAARIVVQMDDSAGTNVDAAYIDFIMRDVSAGTEDVEMTIDTMIGGSRSEHLSVGQGMVGIWSNGLTPDATARGVALIGIGTEPAAAVAGGAMLYAKDSSDGATNATLGLYTEQAVEVIGTFTASHKLKMWINGTEYWVQLDAV